MSELNGASVSVWESGHRHRERVNREGAPWTLQIAKHLFQILAQDKTNRERKKN